MDEAIVRPVDDKLIAMLKGAKKVMKKVEANDFSTGHINPDALTEKGIQKLHESGVVAKPRVNNSETNISDEDYETRVNKSGLPDAVKKAMLEKKIEQPTMSSFNLDDVRSLIDEDEERDFKIQTPKTNPNVNKSVNKAIIKEQTNNDFGGIGRNELKGMIKDIMLEYLSTEFTKTLTESVIKQTINTLIKEGKLTVKKKI